MKLKIKISTALSLLYPVSNSVRFSLVGQLAVAEAISFLVAISLVFKRRVAHLPPIGVSLFYLLILASLVISDLYNQSAFVNYARGWASIVVSWASLVFFVFVFSKDLGAARIYVLSMSMVAMLYFNGDTELNGPIIGSNWFKIRHSPYLFALFAFLSSFFFQKSRFYSVLILYLGGLFLIIFGARSDGGSLFVAGAILQFMGGRSSIRNLVISTPLIISVLYLSYVLYINFVINLSISGNAINQVSRLSDPYNPFELLRMGRTQLFAGLVAVSENPFWGYGSWALDEGHNFNEYISIFRGELSPFEALYIPSHSMLVGAWVWGGLGAFIGILGIFGYFLKNFLQSLRCENYVLPIICAYGVLEIWHFLFSPFGHIRTSLPFILALVLTTAGQVRVQKRRHDSASIPA